MCGAHCFYILVDRLMDSTVFLLQYYAPSQHQGNIVYILASLTFVHPLLSHPPDSLQISHTFALRPHIYIARLFRL